ncbi:MAG: hypothetical protein RR795_01545 [Cetobacterium sp.]|uniref:hypothetical protein n=1 Tax=Cetobacterium sp. TaxID=2071632 RepID=UPI002FC82666
MKKVLIGLIILTSVSFAECNVRAVKHIREVNSKVEILAKEMMAFNALEQHEKAIEKGAEIIKMKPQIEHIIKDHIDELDTDTMLSISKIMKAITSMESKYKVYISSRQ